MIVNGKDLPSDPSSVYIYIDFIKPSRHFYTVTYNEKTFVNKMMIKSR